MGAAARIWTGQPSSGTADVGSDEVDADADSGSGRGKFFVCGVVFDGRTGAVVLQKVGGVDDDFVDEFVVAGGDLGNFQASEWVEGGGVGGEFGVSGVFDLFGQERAGSGSVSDAGVALGDEALRLRSFAAGSSG